MLVSGLVSQIKHTVLRSVHSVKSDSNANAHWGLYCVLGQDSLDTILLQCLSPRKSIKGYWRTVRKT